MWWGGGRIEQGDREADVGVVRFWVPRAREDVGCAFDSIVFLAADCLQQMSRQLLEWWSC
eukprot:768626-Hanusia_phi.AAC.13